MNMKALILTFLFSTTALVLASCAGSDEADDIAKAQKCLDEVPESDPASASNCMQYVAKYTSQQAYILKCSIAMAAGGLMESKTVNAYKILKGDSVPEPNRNTAFMAALALDVPTIADGYTKAKEADVFCQKTGISGLMFLSGVVLSGSWMAKTMADLTGNPNLDLSDPNAVNAGVDHLLNSAGGCLDASPPPTCDQDLEVLGTAVASLSNNYCNKKGADAKVCDEINDATEAAGNNATAIGQALLCYLKKRTYNPDTQTCN